LPKREIQNSKLSDFEGFSITKIDEKNSILGFQSVAKNIKG
jgi:hypothetical protein